MSKWADVPITILKTYAVEIEDHENEKDVERHIEFECLGDTFEIGHITISKNEHEAKQIKALADERLSI